MHPEMLRALARARHEDLLNRHRTRSQPKVQPGTQLRLFARTRRGVGSLLIGAGARVLGEERAALQVTHAGAVDAASPRNSSVTV
jgi:hypothetical protein